MRVYARVHVLVRLFLSGGGGWRATIYELSVMYMSIVHACESLRKFCMPNVHVSTCSFMFCRYVSAAAPCLCLSRLD